MRLKDDAACGLTAGAIEEAAAEPWDRNHVEAVPVLNQLLGASKGETLAVSVPAAGGSSFVLELVGVDAHIVVPNVRRIYSRRMREAVSG